MQSRCGASEWPKENAPSVDGASSRQYYRRRGCWIIAASSSPRVIVFPKGSRYLRARWVLSRVCSGTTLVAATAILLVVRLSSTPALLVGIHPCDCHAGRDQPRGNRLRLSCSARASGFGRRRSRNLRQGGTPSAVGRACAATGCRTAGSLRLHTGRSRERLDFRWVAITRPAPI